MFFSPSPKLLTLFDRILLASIGLGRGKELTIPAKAWAVNVLDRERGARGGNLTRRVAVEAVADTVVGATGTDGAALVHVLNIILPAKRLHEAAVDSSAIRVLVERNVCNCTRVRLTTVLRVCAA